MHARVRTVLLASAALAALVPSGSAAALSGPAPSHTAASQSQTWTIVPSANRKGGGIEHNNTLLGTSCLSASACTAVGYSISHARPNTLIESWNGSSWSLVPSPNRLSANFLYGVSCTSASACIAVGDTFSKRTPYRTLTESWNGTAWSVVPSPDPARGLGVEKLFGVSCVSASACTAVGYYGPRTGGSKPLIVTWNGSTWSRVHAPGKGISSALQSVSCVGTTFCTAVGGYSTSRRHTGSLIESWNGTAWSVVPGTSDEPTAVSCVSADFCVATGGFGKTQIESWNGTAWSIVPSPDTARPINSLTGVSCAASNACTTVGYSGGNGPSQTLVESWDGTAWSIVPSPNAGGTNTANALNDVACPSAAACLAAGWRNGGKSTHGLYQTLTELGTSSG